MFSNIKIKSSLGNLRLLYYIKIESAMVVWYKVFSGVLAIVTVLRGVNGDEMSFIFGEESVGFLEKGKYLRLGRQPFSAAFSG